MSRSSSTPSGSSAASALRWNWSTQIGAIAATTALLAVLSACRLRRASKDEPARAEIRCRASRTTEGGALQEQLQRCSLIPTRCWHETILPIWVDSDSSPANMTRQITNSGPSSICRANNSLSHPCHLAQSRHPSHSAFRRNFWDAGSTSETYGPETLLDRRSLGIESETTQTGIDCGTPRGSAQLGDFAAISSQPWRK